MDYNYCFNNFFTFFIVSIVILPIGWIGRTLVYYDLRVRKEGYAIDDLADAFHG